MKTKIFKTVCLVSIILLMNNLVLKAQYQPFFDTKWNESGKVVSKTMFAMGDFGFCEPKWIVNYTYDEEGDFLKKEYCVWNQKYDLNEKTGRWVPDYSEVNWTPQYCYIQKRDLIKNLVTKELLIWNKKEKRYDNPIESMTYQLKDENHFSYLVFTKGDKFEELVNNINIDNDLLAGSEK
jgi:hypothetical protein